MSRIVNESVNECILYENRKNKVLRTTIEQTQFPLFMAKSLQPYTNMSYSIIIFKLHQEEF